MALSEQQRKQLELYMNQLSKAELNKNLESQYNFRNWLYREHYSFYVQVKDVLDELWDISKQVAKGVLTAVGVTAGVAVCVAAAPFYILGKIFGVIDD